MLLPAPVTFTAGRVTFRIARDGQLRRVAATPLRFHPSQRLYFVADGAVMTQPVGSRLLELLEGRRLVVLRPDGSVFAEALVPRRRSIDSPIAVAPDGRAVAFSTSYTLRAASPDPARGALDLETVYVLRAGARTATPLHTGGCSSPPVWVGQAWSGTRAGCCSAPARGPLP